jgi:hypothetical protein
MRLLALAVFVLAVAQPARDDAALAARLFDGGQTFTQFLAGTVAQRREWHAEAALADVDPVAIERLTRARDGLRLLVVAEDWCVDSAHIVPYAAKLAEAAHVELRIVNRTVGAPLLTRHPTRDGRPATPTIVVIRRGRDVGAFVERPTPLQTLFERMATDSESARRFADRAKWYEQDRGRTTLDELLGIIERR